MRTTFSLSLFLFFLGSCCMSCQKKHDTMPDPSRLTIWVHSPLQGQSYHMNDTVHLDVDLNYVEQLQNCRLRLLDMQTGDVLFDEMQPVLDTSCSLRKTWLNSLSKSTSLKFQVIVNMDARGNAMRKEIVFQSR